MRQRLGKKTQSNHEAKQVLDRSLCLQYCNIPWTRKERPARRVGLVGWIDVGQKRRGVDIAEMRQWQQTKDRKERRFQIRPRSKRWHC